MAASKPSPAKSAAKDETAVLEDGAAIESEAEDASSAKADVVKIKDFMVLVNTAMGGKKKASRDVVDATLTALAEAMATGKNFILPPLGRGRVVKQADGVLTLKLRQITAAKGKGDTAKEPLAATEE
ncbi:MAG: hypothetical protein V4712_01210 [Pseudomonadota bacterium]